MAATVGPDRIVETRLVVPASMDSMASQMTPLSSSPTSPRSQAPLPNPPFVFPARPSSSSAPSSFSRATGRRPMSAIEPRQPNSTLSDMEDSRSKSPALPIFSFNPGANFAPAPAAESLFLSPPQSPSAPTSPRAMPARPTAHGHRRGGSEFVGGSIRDGEAITVLSTSPTKSESGMASPLLEPTKPPARRRGHAHRRSAAISSHDLSSIILPLPQQNLRGNSAPSSPAVTDRPTGPDFPGLKQSPSESEPAFHIVMDASGSDDTPVPAVQPEQQPKPAARNRVGFSDTLEFIPRPLSLVSSDASSTATARPGHSGSGSISSVISVTNVDRDLTPTMGFSSTRRMNETRPSTAGAILERTENSQAQDQEQEQAARSPRRRGSIPFLGSLPPPSPVSPTTPSPTKSGKKWTFFGLDPFVAGSPSRSPPISPCPSDSHPKQANSTCSSAEKIPDAFLKDAEDEAAEQKPAGKKRSKKQKKVKTWAGSILSRKSKQRYGKQKRRTPTPPPLRDVDGEGCADEAMEMFPEPVMPIVTITGLSEQEDSVSGGSPRRDSFSDEDEDEETSYPMIDLDAALGPFNTPLPRNPEWEAAQKAGGLIKKQLHSAAGMSRFSGPGMHYHHRRAESAPEMVPFDSGRFGFPRFGSSSTMADVFEEDEEDEGASSKESSGHSTPIADTLVVEEPQIIVAAEDDAVDSSDMEAHSPLPHANRLPDNDGYNSNSATPSPRHALRPKVLTPMEVSPLNLPVSSLAPISPYSMTQSSAFPSPRSPISYDAHRISTAPSSITEDNFHSLLMGEPGPEVRISVDDIPSLTSSNSTMTRESIFGHNPQARHPPLSDQPRPASFTSTAFGRRRSSLASLSRLISSSHGERSKLSIEVTMDSDTEKKAKVSKTKRLSRMVQFWKSKETTT
ncbi:hypothetical protein B0T26DRAFT_737422 [Lasiosphaeria miniovina]|uniref:Cell wall proline rich protein n=1 Tax=Lasiosphaeria miniovina TaxID=1954250 RepID=A0AA40BIQ0_9PEZI|nr:uncharacterized protein B0T26DRAFT_737422 [Lasiosphaeria miniovina]KAK0734942.1 hypothetical protein B0T26DRAFT_737422 [Lasiosphaeria miniovina]